jgi:hypothetical protein
VCAACGMGGEATYDSLLECVAHHNHMRCVGIDYMPVSWLCAPCICHGGTVPIPSIIPTIIPKIIPIKILYNISIKTHTFI